VLITGAAGFVGRYTAHCFQRQGWKVWGYDLRPPAAPSPGMEFIQGDILDPVQLQRAVVASGATGIIHQAGIIGEPLCRADQARAVAVNVQGTSAVLEIARAHDLRFTFISTATLYGRDPTLRPLAEEDPADPVGIYDATKHMAETLCLTYGKAWGVDVTAVRTSFVYGEGHQVGTYYLDDAREGRSIQEAAGADHPCEYTYVKDVARGIFLAHTVRPLRHRLFNITSGVQHPRKDLIALVRAAIPDARIDVGPGISESANLRGPCQIHRARIELGYEPAYSLETGFADWLATSPTPTS
ncbi:MAG: NAD(P)-dependent oxidoreductase, partial [Gemmatimonadetes bacterium]|nr:NAD(P)-dependent oxidoreductase [Gemmatimonadota bacterium]